MRIRFLYFFIVLIATVSCTENNTEKKFRLIPGSESGITFRNDLTPTVEFNIFNYMYFYNGGGVAAGDVNGDGLMDAYFSSNQNGNKLYLNKGKFKFEDITEAAHAGGLTGWATGVTMADVNGDGRLDIYVGYVGKYQMFEGRNLLLINEGNDAAGVPQFADRTVEYGLDLVGFSTQAAFFDYDRDGDLDMYMLNHSLHQNGTFGKSFLRYESHPLAGDKLLRNDGNRFSDVTRQSGIYNSVIGYGLGIAISDVNLDGWPDIYVGNDFHENDYLYINQGDGTFRETLEKSMQHTSHFSMGCDFADFNNDAFPDLISMDMLPQDPMILKASAAEDTYDLYAFKINYGYNYQYARNTFQVSQRDGTFSEIGLMAGVFATDWSWGTMFVDFDLDGQKDIFISNGIERRSNDLDYINFITIDSIQDQIKFDMRQKEMEYFKKMPQIKIPNCLYINNGDSTFTNKAAAWGMNQPSYSHGSAYADFDNDGDLDLIVNNAADEAFLYENLFVSAKEGKQEGTNGFVQVTLKGKGKNTQGLGARVFLYGNGGLQVLESMATRGYQSAVDTRLVFGIGTAAGMDSLVVIWPDQTYQTLKSIGRNQQLTLDQNNASGTFSYASFHSYKPLFRNTSAEFPIAFKHRENKFVEFNRENLIPHMVSAEGPAVAVADVNGDGLEDAFFGNGKWSAPELFIQQKTGDFKKINNKLLRLDSTYEEVDAEFFDADGDGDKDLFVLSGGNEWNDNSQYMQPRLFLNDGKGDFSDRRLINVFLTGAVSRASDFDKDGDMDVFVGARSIPWKYGMMPDSYLLINDGKGNFTPATGANGDLLKEFALVKDAIWKDIDNDGDVDLVVAAEWSPIIILVNENGQLKKLPLQDSGLENTEGWWNVVESNDYDGDGDADFIFGNLGLNSKLRASTAKPVRLWVCDFDKNESYDQILSHYINDKEYPFYTRDEMTKQLPYLKKKYLSYHKYAEATLQDIFTKEQLAECKILRANMFEHVYVENLGGGKFKVTALPTAAQFSTVNAVVSGDFDADGKVDAIVAGNFYPVNVQMGRYDASYGLLLKGNGRNGFVAIPPIQSGISVSGETRVLQKLTVRDKEFIIAVRNNDTLVSFSMIK